MNKQRTLFDRAGHVALVACVLFLFLNANSAPKLKYTPYQMLVWELKANEGYRSWWYPDGYNRGKKAYSIGFGWNDLGCRRREEIKEFTKDKKVTFNEALKISLKEVSKYGKLHKDPLRNLALVLHSYNCGLTTSGKDLSHCCGGKVGCGSPKANVRLVHNERRRYEVALWNHDIVNIVARTEKNKARLSTYVQILKNRGEL